MHRLEQKRAWNLANKDKLRAYNEKYRVKNRAKIAAYYQTNKAKIIAKAKKRYEENRSLILAQIKVRYQANRQRYLEYAKIYNGKNREQIRARLKLYTAANWPAIRAAHLKWERANPDVKRSYRDQRRARKMACNGQYTKADVVEIINLQRNRCGYCRILLRGKYHVDHILPLALGGSNDRRNIQILCPPCNCRKRATHPIEFAQQIGMLI